MTDFIRPIRMKRLAKPESSMLLPDKLIVDVSENGEIPENGDVADDDALEPELVELREKYALRPLDFNVDTFAWGSRGSYFFWDKPGLLPWQIDMLGNLQEDLLAGKKRHRIAIAGGRGIGKSGALVGIGLWHMSTRRHSHTIITSVTGAQSTTKIWKEWSDWVSGWKYRELFRLQRTRMMHPDFENTWFAMTQTWSIDNPQGFRGAHANSVMYLVDEACGVPDTIFEQFRPGLTDPENFAIYFSNPSRPSGAFYRCFHDAAEQRRWTTYTIDARSVSIVSRESIEETLEYVGGDTNASIYRSDVLALFPIEGHDQVIPEWILERACSDVDKYGEPKYLPDPRYPIVMGVDVAAGGENLSVFVVRQDSQLLEVQSYPRMELPDVQMRLIELMERYLNKYQNREMKVYIDADGVGKQMYQELFREGYPVYAVDSGLPAQKDKQYVNRRAEAWYTCRDWLKEKAWLNPDERYYKTLHMQLTDIYYHHDETRRVKIESKKEMMARGLRSPDFADALVYSCMDMVQGQKIAGTFGR